MLSIRTSVTLTQSESVAYIVGAVLVCASLFAVTWVISASWPALRRHFASFTYADKCDWCSRVPSVTHSLVILFFLLKELGTLDIDDNFQTRGDTRTLERNICFSIGYFLYDALLTIHSRMYLWQLYLFHHVAALWPLLSILYSGCGSYIIFGCTLFLVEVTIVPLQIVHWCETTKNKNSLLHSIGFHATFWLWIPFRFVFPAWICYRCIWLFMPLEDLEGSWCKVALAEGGLSIWGFCWLIFFSHIAPGYWKRITRRVKED